MPDAPEGLRPLNFAVVREDPAVEAALVSRASASAALVVASGGCTALSLKARFPQLEVAAFDLNPAQLNHCREKVAAVTRGDVPALARLSDGGEFEKLFDVLRHFLETFIGPPSRSLDEAERFIGSPYWPVAFKLAFDESLLLAMFGPEAIRHAEPGSYPAYFQHAFERGLRATDAAHNPWLQHLLLGWYEDEPEWFRAARPLVIEWVSGSLTDVPRLERFNLVSLSNIFDWSDEALVAQWSRALTALPKGAHVVWRQLNNRRDWTRFFSPAFEVDRALSDEWTARERSLFYERVTIAVRV